MPKKQEKVATPESQVAGKLMAIAESMDSYLRSSNLQANSFGKQAIMNVSRDGTRGIIKAFSNKVFGPERAAIGESAGAVNNSAINSKLKLELVEKLQKEYEARAENLMLETQTSGGVLNNITTHHQMYMVALTAGIIQPSYNKIFPTVVEPNPMYVRQINVPKVIDAEGKSYIMADVINDNEKLAQFASNSNSLLTFSLNFTAVGTTHANVNANIIDEFNKSVGSGKQIGSPKNFMNRGFTLVSLVYDDNGTEVIIPIDDTSMENQIKSGEISNKVGRIHTVLSAKKTGLSDIELHGSATIDGTFKIISDNPNVKSIKIAFNLPPVGLQEPFKTTTFVGKYSRPITQVQQAICNLNEMFLDDYNFYVGKDAIEDFTTQVFTMVNQIKDNYALQKVDDLITELGTTKNGAYSNEENFFSSELRSRFFGDTLDMNVAGHEYPDSTTSNNIALAQRLYKMVNNIDKFMHPMQKNFSMYSDSALPQWLKDPYGTNISKFNIVGNAGNEIAGINTLYDMMRTTIGDYYSANYVATNRVKTTTREISGIGNVPANKKALVDVSTLTVFLNGEADKDTFVFASGKEYLHEGTGSFEDPSSPSLNYQTRFEAMVFNKVLGRLTFIEKPTSIY